ncbi:MAG: acyl carrier protein [Candidatus Omnitrophica bacterium]|nr:acyl carrier protein [Candidatus Omnitrophota bacterium]
MEKQISGMKQTTEERLQKLLNSVFPSRGAYFKDTDSPSEISGWDSLNHLNLVMAINNEFCVNLGFEEMLEIKRVGDIKVILKRHKVD